MELLGLIDTLESIVLDGTRLPFTKRAVVDEEKVLGVIDKIRLVVQAGGELARSVVDVDKRTVTVTDDVPADVALPERPRMPEPMAVSEVLEQAYELAREIRNGADKYADEVLANLEATSARILRAIRAGRDRLKPPAGE